MSTAGGPWDYRTLSERAAALLQSLAPSPVFVDRGRAAGIDVPGAVTI
ncbi:MAG: hypothetical protein ACOC9T_02645 [Myxococcota bacterium]